MMVEKIGGHGHRKCSELRLSAVVEKCQVMRILGM